jgi:hypothetical protein
MDFVLIFIMLLLPTTSMRQKIFIVVLQGVLLQIFQNYLRWDTWKQEKREFNLKLKLKLAEKQEEM